MPRNSLSSPVNWYANNRPFIWPIKEIVIIENGYSSPVDKIIALLTILISITYLLNDTNAKNETVN